MKDFKFEIIHKDSKSKARAGKITTARGVIETPSFVAVGTKASVKGLSPKDLKETGVQLLFGNTYHLHLRPGEDVVKKFGGLGKFMGWDGPTITDSGGFQVFSLARVNARGLVINGAKVVAHKNFLVRNAKKVLSADRFKNPASTHNENFVGSSRQDEFHTEEPQLVKITEDGVIFRSHLDGSLHEFSPEKSIEIQKKLGADMILALDECTPHPSSHEYTREAMERTHKWAIRSLKTFQTKPFYHRWKQALYGIIQGGVYKDLREQSAKFVSKLDFDGIAIGGVSVGESKKQMRDTVDWCIPFLSEEKPLHLLGIGEIDDIFDVIERGMDTFDCVIPTRFGRYGIVFLFPLEGNIKNRFRIDLSKSLFAKDKGPIAKDCLCYTCQNFTRGYLHHLFRANELLAYRLASYHNMFFINNLVKKIREAILEDRFEEMKKKWLII